VLALTPITVVFGTPRIDTLDSSSDTGHQLSATHVGGSRPAVSYVQHTLSGDKLWLLRAEQADAAVWADRSPVSEANILGHPTGFLVENNLFCLSQRGGSLYLHTATDALGDNFSFALLLEEENLGESFGYDCSGRMRLNGMPGVAHRSDAVSPQSGRILYTYEDGGWSTVDIGGTLRGRRPSVNDGGFPAVVFTRVDIDGDRDLYFTSANDWQGSSWNPTQPIVLGQQVETAQHCLLRNQLLDTQLVVFWSETDAMLRSVHAPHPHEAWSEPQDVGPAADCGSRFSLAYINFTPCVVWVDGNSIMYSFLSVYPDNWADGWREPYHVTTIAGGIGGIDLTSSTILESGRPLVFLQDLAGPTLKAVVF
jgi:hypothetical protein